MDKNAKVYDCIVIGGGPSGATAAVYAVRGGLSAAIIDGGGSALLRAENVQNYYGFSSISGAELYRAGLAQAASVGADVIDGQVTFVESDGSVFTVTTTRGVFRGRRVVIAVGASGMRPAGIAGLKELEGKGVSYCAVCDGFFFRKKRVGVIGAGEYAKHEYDTLKAVAGEAVLLTNGETPTWRADKEYTEKIARMIERDGRCGGVEFANGETLELDGVFAAIGVMGGTGLAKSMGAFIDERGFVLVDGRGMTNVPGLYAAGDCTPGTKQIGKAVADGITAGLSIVAELRGN